MKLFIYFSEIIGEQIVDSTNQVIGELYDLGMLLNEEVFPVAESLIVKRGGINREYAKIAFCDVRSIKDIIKLNVTEDHVHFQKDRIRPDFSLRRDVMDQQVVDTHDQKVVRVNDIHLLNVENQFFLAHVDIGLRGIVRRLEWSKLIDGLIRIFAPKSPYLTQEGLISWKNTQVLFAGRKGNVLRSDEARKKIAKIPPSDLAGIMEDLNIFERVSLFRSFPLDLQRKVFTDMPTQEKEKLVDQLNDQEAVSLLENIPADEATDLLLSLPKARTKLLMHLMQTETSQKLRKLLGFEQDTAGGLMTTEYLALSENATVADAWQKIKDNVDYPGNIYHIYIVDDKQRLVAVTSLRRFINADPGDPLLNHCSVRKIFVRTDSDMEEVALLLEKYKFTAVPVLNEDNVIKGVVTSDDVMEELISLAWKKYEGQL